MCWPFTCISAPDKAAVRAQGWWYGLVVVASLGMTSTAVAQINTIERLVMPGPVSSAHADIEATCTSCHVRFSRDLQGQLCLDCHEEVARDVAASTGFHGRDPGAVGAECSACHTEHEGRNADILGIDEDSFDHDVTNFPLLGKHRDVMCASCHTEELPNYHAAETECNACHVDDDRHRGNLGTACADCHAETAWTDVRFDHEMTADYTLTGKHAEITCVSCHVDEQYEQTPNTCIGCHAEDDNHRGNNGAECQECHTTRDWTDLKFDHLTRTGFALAGAHGGLECEACHEGNKLTQATPNECIGCHRDDDAHDGVNGTMCQDCHRVTEWPDVTFDHARDTDFALHGAHAALTCAACHMQPVSVAVPSTGCIGCHAEDDPHEGQLGEACNTCHVETRWAEDVRFDHDLARFPLLGKHDDVTCESCHATQAFLDASEQCVDCHMEDDVHERRLGLECATCHNPNDWLAWTFDHDAQTSFPLTGAHVGLNCHGCHREPVPASGAISLASTCGSCHRNDDVHRGEFGADCAQCHTTESFRDLKELP